MIVTPVKGTEVAFDVSDRSDGNFEVLGVAL